MSLAEQEKGLHLNEVKKKLVNTVCASMIAEPKFDNDTDTGASLILKLVQEIAVHDPEFILKLAVYVRHDLNIRSTANFLVALAAEAPTCAPYIKKYYKKICHLPSDWLDVAALYQMLPHRALNGRALPTSLRKAMKFKFPDFDTYQLGKYNKAGKIKRKKKKEKQAAATGREIVKPAKAELTIKQMVRQLHIAQPVSHVMCILGKKYPADQTSFYSSGLPGTFDKDRAGKRMKLPVPETWETMLSAKGNKAETWEELIDHRKLPFMAMLRNLRNLILTGVDYKYHRIVWSKLNNEKTVASSRQFPFRFFSAYQAIDVNIEKLREEIKEAKIAAAAGGGAGVRKPKPAPKPKGRGRGRGKVEEEPRRPKKVIIPKNMPDEALLKKYKEALDNAVKFATVYNVKPIRGATVVFCSVAEDMRQSAKNARGMGSARTTQDMGVLLGLMCKYMCEDCDFRIFASSKGNAQNHLSVELKEGTILDNMGIVGELAVNGELGTDFQFPFDYLESMIRDKKRIDNFIVLSNKTIGPGYDNLESESPNKTGLSGLLQKYRQDVNPDLLFVNVNLAAPTSIQKGGDEGLQTENDVSISGFSDAILKYIAERGDNNQLHYIEHIDQSKNIKNPLNSSDRNSTSSLFSFSTSNSSTTTSYKSKINVRSKFNSSINSDDDEKKNEEISIEQIKNEEEKKLKNKLQQMKDGKLRVVRVFVSSTFRDMHGERDYLTKYVFPELRKRCKAKRIAFYDVDLRWGVTEKEAEDGGALEVCLNEVDRCRPFFLGIFGDRYGWIPDQYVVGEDPKWRWVREYPQGRSVTELEMHYGALINPDDSRAFFYERNNSFLHDIREDREKTVFLSEGQDAVDKMTDLKSRINQFYNIKKYNCKYGGVNVSDGKTGTSDLHLFGKLVLDDLWNGICQLYPDSSDFKNDLEIERSFHVNFMDSHHRKFVGRKDCLKNLLKYVNDHEDTRSPFIVTGDPGAGKSAVMSQFVKEFSVSHPDAFVIAHFIGAAPGSSDIRHTLLRIAKELTQKFDLPNSVPEDYKELRQAFPHILENASFCGKILLIIDGLNQLNISDRAHSLDWLPSNSRVKIIVSTYLSSKTYDVLKHRKPTLPELSVGPLDETNGKILVRNLLAEYRKKLDESPGNNQMRFLIRKTDAKKPLYLVVACEELRVFGIYEKLTTKIKSLAPSVDRLFDEVLRRFEADHDKNLIKIALSAICVSRNGVTEEEMIEILGSYVSEGLNTITVEKPKYKFGSSSRLNNYSKKIQDESQKEKENIKKNVITELPFRIWAPIMNGLLPFLKPVEENGGVLNLFHGQFVAAVQKRYLALRGFENTVHKLLANYFLKRADPNNDKSFINADKRAVSELPYHMIRGDMPVLVQEVLTNLNFIETKCKMGMTFDLVNDLSTAVQFTKDDDNDNYGSSSISGFGKNEDLENNFESDDQLIIENKSDKEKLIDFHTFISSNAYILHAQPNLTLQQAVNQPNSSLTSFLANKQININEPNYIKWINKPNQKSACTMTMAGSPSEAPMACAYSPDGSQFVIACKDQTLKICDSITGLEEHTLIGHTNWVVSVAYSSDGRSIVSGSWDETVKIWDPFSGAELCSLIGHTRRVNTVAYSVNCRLIASGAWDCSVRVWNADDGKEIKMLSGHTKPVNSVCFSPDNNYLCSASWDGTIKIWLVGEGKNQEEGKEYTCIKTLLGHTQSVRDVRFSPSGNQIVSTSVDSTVKLWDFRTGKLSLNLSGHSLPVNSCSFSADGKQLVSASDDLTVRVWDALGGREVGVIKTGAGADKWISRCDFAPDCIDVVCAYSDCSIGIWDTQVGEEVESISKAHNRTINACVYTFNGEQIITASEDGYIKIWGWIKNVFSCLHEIYEHRDSVNDIAIHPDGNSFLSASDDFTLKLFDIKTGDVINTWRGHSAPVTSVCFSSDGKRAASVSRDKMIRLWDPKTGDTKAVMRGHTDWIVSCCFSPDNKKLITGSWDFTVKSWDARSGKELGTMTGHLGAVSCVSYSSDGKYIVSGSFDSTLKIWDAVECHEITTLSGHTSRINCCKFAKSGSLIISSADDGTMRVWDAVAGQEITLLQGHSESVNYVSFNPLKNEIVSTSQDGTVKVWNANAQREIKGHNQWATDVKSSGNLIVSSSRDKTIKLWNVDTCKIKSSLDNPHNDSVINCVAVSPDSNVIFSGGDDFYLHYWDLQSGLKKLLEKKHSNAVRSLQFSNDGTMVASAGWDGTVCLWDGKSGTFLKTLSGHTDYVECVAFGNSNSLASGSHDASIILWEPFSGRISKSLYGHSNWVTGVAFNDSCQYLVSVSFDGLVKLWNVNDECEVWSVVGHGGRRVNCCVIGRGSFGQEFVASGGNDRRVVIWNRDTGDKIGEFYCKAPVTSVTATSSGMFVASDSLGNVYMFTLENQ